MKIQSKKYEGVRSKELSGGDVAFYVRWTDRNGKRIEIKVGTKNQGWNEKKAYWKKVDLQNKEEEKHDHILFEEVAKRYLEVQKLHLKASSFRSYRAKIDHLLKFFSSKEVMEITSRDVHSLMIELGKDHQQKTINSITSILSAVLKFASKEYGVENNVMEDHKKLKVDNARERFLSKEEVAKLREALSAYPEHLLFMLLSLSTGARLMSVLGICKKDVNLKSQSVILSDYKNGGKYTGFLNDEVCEILKKRWSDLKDEDKVIRKSRRPITEKLREVMNELFNDGVSDAKHRVVIHTLRHTFASHLAISGTPLQIIQKLLNHKDIKMTMRYAHLLPDSGRDYVLKLWS